MMPCFTRSGMQQMVAWFMAEKIIARFDADHAAYMAKAAADPTYKPDPFADKGGGTKDKRSDADKFADYCAEIRNGVGSRRGMRA